MHQENLQLQQVEADDSLFRTTRLNDRLQKHRQSSSQPHKTRDFRRVIGPRNATSSEEAGLAIFDRSSPLWQCALLACHAAQAPMTSANVFLILLAIFFLDA